MNRIIPAAIHILNNFHDNSSVGPVAVPSVTHFRPEAGMIGLAELDDRTFAEKCCGVKTLAVSIRDRKFACLAGRRAVVTGSSSGIGRAIALELAAAGAEVVVHCRRSGQQADEVVEAIRSTGGTATALAADFSDSRALVPFVEAACPTLRGIDVWVNNAGVDLLTGAAADLPFDDKLRRLLDVDVQATMILGREVGRRMCDAGQGCILNIGWDQADRGMEGEGGQLFSAAKNAVMGFTRSLALSLAPAVRVNCLAAGWVRTAWGEQAGRYWQQRVRSEIPLGRWGTPRDVAAAARFLVSSDASFITGQVININGGAVR